MAFPMGNLPTTGEKQALAGTSGSPATSNEYRTRGDHGDLLNAIPTQQLGAPATVSSLVYVDVASITLGPAGKVQTFLAYAQGHFVPAGTVVASLRLFDSDTSLVIAEQSISGVSGDSYGFCLVGGDNLPQGVTRTVKLQAKVDASNVAFQTTTKVGAIYSS